MRTYKSTTGYVRNKIDNSVYEVNTIYLGRYDKEDNYEDITKEEYENANRQETEQACNQ